MSRRILLVEDDPTLRIGLDDALAGEGYAVTTAADGDSAHELLFSRHFDLVVLDLMLPGRGGLELLRELREAQQQVPVLVLTARGDETDKVLGLELGADDYVTKPFGLRELLARVRALLRRVGGHGIDRAPAAPPRFAIGAVAIDLEAYQMVRDGEVMPLSPTEVAMLALLRAQAGKAVSRERFLDEVWGSDQFVGPRTVDTHMLHLRQKVEVEPRQPRYLRTVHGVGYRLELEGDAP
ncbi:MAG: response regulator transcription factor [Planctomycetota bacterium]